MNIRELSQKVAGHPRIELAVQNAIRAELPGVIESILSEMYPGESVRIYAPKKPVNMRHERDNAIRLEYNGHNYADLAKKYKVSTSHVFRIVSGKK